MSFAPYAVLWVILVAAAGLCLIAGRRTLIHLAASLLAPLLAFVLWFAFRPGAAAPAATLAGRPWVVGQTAWGLTGVVLLLLLSAVVFAFLGDDGPERAGTRPAWLLGLAAAALPVVWAADDRSRILALAFFGLVWFAAHMSTGRINGDDARPMVWPLVALFPLWLASAWPAARPLLSLAAAALLLGVWPFGGPRRGAAGDAPLNLLADGLPVVAGSAVMAAGLGAGVPTGLEIAFATALAFFSLVAGLARVWRFSFDSLVKALGPALAGMTLMAAVWVGDGAMLQAARLAVFAPAVLVIVANLFPRRSPDDAARSRLSPGMVGSAVVFAAVAGLPLTAGFVALAALYGAWLASGGWVLALVLVLLLSLWLAAVYLTIRQAAAGFASGRDAWLRGGALLLPALGLLQFNAAAFGAGPLVWVAIALPPVAGLLLGRFVPGLGALDDLLRESIPAALPSSEWPDRLRRVGQATADAIADAIAILEGEFGLLWLVGLIALLLWII